MNDGLLISLTTYALTIGISFFVAVIIKLMVVIMSKFSKGEEIDEEEQMIEEARAAVSGDDAEIAAVIAIAKTR